MTNYRETRTVTHKPVGTLGVIVRLPLAILIAVAAMVCFALDDLLRLFRRGTCRPTWRD